MKVLIVGHSCSPSRGSEPSFTWNWAWELSRWHRIWVIAHPRYRDDVEDFLNANPNPNLHFHWQEVPGWLDSWNPKANDRGLGLHYMVWLKFAYRKAYELHQMIGFDIVHHVSYGTVSAPPPFRRLRVPFIWGPVGGAQEAPRNFKRYFGPSWKREVLRNSRVHLLRFSPSLRRAAQASAVTLATNHETATLLERIGARDVRLFLDSGVPEDFVTNDAAKRLTQENLTLLWAGRMQPRKALPLALEAVAELKDIHVKLLVAGDGEMRSQWEEYARSLGVETQVQFLGHVPWHKIRGLYQQSDAFLFTSLRDSFGVQVLEAMAHGLPVLALGHQGVATFVPIGAGITVPVSEPSQSVRGIANAIRWLAQNREAGMKLGKTGQAYARAQTWSRRAECMSNLYEEMLHMRPSPQLGGPAPYGAHGIKKRIGKIEIAFDLKGKRVLDVGCGNGCYTAEFAERAESVCGVDAQMHHLRAFRQTIPRVQAVAEDLPFASESFDLVTLIEVLEHTRSDRRVLEECFRVLKPNGSLLVFAPNKLYPLESHPCRVGQLSLGRNIPFISWFPAKLRKHLCDAKIYTLRQLFMMCRDAGFQVQRSGYMFPPLDSLAIPFKKFYRRASKRLEDSFAGKLGVSIFAVFQKPLVRAMNAERVTPKARSEFEVFDVLGVGVRGVQIRGVVSQMESWIEDRSGCHSIAATSMHGIVEAQRDPAFKEILNSTDLVVPDGMPLVWLGRRRGFRLPRRVYGPDLLLSFCEESVQKGYKHFFYGGEPGVAERLAESLTRRFPGVQIVGTYSPPFRRLDAQEDQAVIGMITRASPDVLWVGLGAPKQERWMHEYREKLPGVPALVGVGAAFDMLSGRRKQAPQWMQNHGLEWFFRLLQEPRRLWRRYLVYGAQFLAYLALDKLHWKDFRRTRGLLEASFPKPASIPMNEKSAEALAPRR